MEDFKSLPGMALSLAPGTRTKQITLSNGAQITIREQNGNDEDIISSKSSALDPLAYSRYISAVVVGPTILSEEEANKLSSRDRVRILIETRILSFGSILEFKFKGYQLSFNLREFLETEDGEVPHKYFITPTPATNSVDSLGTPVHEFENEGSTYRFYPYCGHSEVLLTNLLASNNNVIRENDILRVRKLSLKVGENKFKVISDFKLLNSRSLRGIKSQVEALDPEWAPLISLPIAEGNQEVPVIYIPEFFFPA